MIGVYAFNGRAIYLFFKGRESEISIRRILQNRIKRGACFVIAFYNVNVLVSVFYTVLHTDRRGNVRL